MLVQLLVKSIDKSQIKYSNEKLIFLNKYLMEVVAVLDVSGSMYERAE